MARTATLTTMIARVRRETDQEYDSAVVTSPFITDAFIIDGLNEGVAEYWQALVTAAPDRALTTTAISVVAGTEEYALPSGFQSVRGVDYPVSSDRYVDVLPYAFEERNSLQGPWPIVPAHGGAPFRYHVIRNGVSGSAARISFRPIPTATAAVQLHYVAVPAALSAGADTLDGIIGLEGFCVAYAKDKVYERTHDREGRATAQAEMARLMARVQTEAGRRDRSGLEVVARVRSRHGSNLFPFR
jgi:hypothetical protein